jgi:ABC-type amino acid transport substrate-binding protein
MLTMLAVVTAGHAQTLTGTLKKVKESGTLTMGYRENVPPMSSTGADGKPLGYSIDLCQEIAVAVQQELKLANLAVRWVPVTPEGRVDAVANGTVDIECGVTTATLGRQERVDFTLMTFIDGASIMVVEGAGIGSVADLAGKRIAVVTGTTTVKVLADFLREQSIAATVVPVRDHDEGLAALESSKVDAYVSDRVILIGLAMRVRGTKRLALLPDSLSPTSPTASWCTATTRRSASSPTARWPGSTGRARSGRSTPSGSAGSANPTRRSS